MENGNIYNIFLGDVALENTTEDIIGKVEKVESKEELTSESATVKSTTENLESIVINFSDAVKLMKKDDELSLAEAMSGILKAKLDDANN